MKGIILAGGAVTRDDFYHADDEGGLAWNDPAIGVVWPQIVGKYQGTASADGYMLVNDGAPLNLSEKDQKWSGIREVLAEDEKEKS